jgi:isopentenyl-diphosphate delta-isomerase
MPKVAPMQRRKAEHLQINLEQDVRSALSTGLERYRFIHQALPELDLQEIDTRLTLFGRQLATPFLVSSMTGGTLKATAMNRRLAEAAQTARIAIGVGSQRVAIEDPKQVKTFQVRRYAPDVLLFANLGAVQLNYGYTVEQCRRAVDMIEADALILHLNPLQEAVQDDGSTNFKSLAGKIELICHQVGVPVIAKEVGWGISERTARLLIQCGVAAIDVAGAGGTSWSQVEMVRAPNRFLRELALAFVDWGIPTAESIRLVRRVAPDLPIFASGGLRNGLDIGKCLALGATLGGMAAGFLKAATVSTEAVIEVITLLSAQLRLTMFAAAVRDLSGLHKVTLQEI